MLPGSEGLVFWGGSWLCSRAQSIEGIFDIGKLGHERVQLTGRGPGRVGERGVLDEQRASSGNAGRKPSYSGRKGRALLARKTQKGGTEPELLYSKTSK